MAKTFNDKANELCINLYGLMESKFELKTIFNYILDWKFRKSVNLPNWLKEQVQIYDELNDFVEIKGWDMMIPELASVEILRWINSNINYIGDPRYWETEEKWQTALETYKLKHGDCEDMAILFFVLCRKAGIPSNRVRIVTGEVSGGFGHCWAEFLIAPFAYSMDACYYPELYYFENRKPYIINRSKYKKIWFHCNDVFAFGALK